MNGTTTMPQDVHQALQQVLLYLAHDRGELTHYQECTPAERSKHIMRHVETVHQWLDHDQIQDLETASYMCDGVPGAFEENVLPNLTSAPAGEILALSGMFLNRSMPERADFLAAYGRAVWISDGPRPDPRKFLRQWEERQYGIASCDEPLPF